MMQRLAAFSPPTKEGCATRLTPAPFVKPDASEAEKAAAQHKKAVYMQNIKQAFADLTAGRDGDLYLALQPIFQISRGDYKLAGLEVLARPYNGGDAAPMPGMAEWQVQERDAAMAFLEMQLDFVVASAAKFPGVDISVNVRPDELSGAQEKILQTSKLVRALLVEITEYSPIGDAEIILITSMQSQGVRFALDDVTKVVDAPSNGYAKSGAHACSFELGRRLAELFEVQKLALPMSAVAYRVKVYPTPEHAGGKPVPFLEKQILPHTTGEAPSEAILERKREIESWVSEVRARAPRTRFVIEASVHEADLVGKEGLVPEIPGLFDGSFCTQGGYFGGRAFPPEELLKCMPSAATD